MKMVKSLLLGTAAGLIAVAGAQAADMPVKAKPVLYVKICSLYGDGFYYIPGTDTCLKIGGYVRSQHYYNAGSSTTNTKFFTPSFQDTRIGGQTDYVHRSRTIISFDARQQTEYGTLRTYVTLGATQDSPSAVALYANRAFIQFAGFTWGKAQSFFDFYSVPAHSFFAHHSSDTGDGGWLVAAYTVQFGNGVSATLSLEEARRIQVINTQLTGQGTGAFVANSTNVQFSANDPFTVGMATGGVNSSSPVPPSDTLIERNPDIVLNLRVDQAWGAFQIMAAAHEASGGYYGNTMTGSVNFGHPADKWGWAAAVGLRLNTSPAGSYFQMQATATQGALRYISGTQFAAGSPAYFSGNTLGLGYVADGYYANGTEVELTRAWSINASYDQVWAFNTKWRTSLYGGYLRVTHSGNAKAMIAASTCAALPLAGGVSGGATTATNFAPAGSAALTGSLTGMSNCDPDWGMAWIGTRTQYNITQQLYTGFDVMYTKLYTAFAGTANYRAVANTGRPTGTYNITDQDAVQFTVRFHRDFYP